MFDEKDNEPVGQSGLKNKGQDIKAEDIDIAVGMLTKYMDAEAIAALVSALEILKTDTQNEAYQTRVVDEFAGLGVLQGGALTYAPYLNIFLSDDPFGDD